MAAFRELGVEKGINPEILFDAIEAALVAAYKRNFNAAQNVRVALDRTSGQYHVYAIKTVVEEAEDSIQEISLAMAQQISPDYQLGDTLEVEVTPANFGRIAAQTAKQVVVQRIREAERGIIYEEFSSREGDIVTGIVQRVENRNVYVDLGRTEAIMQQTEQIANEEYVVNDRIKALIIEVKNSTKGPQVLLSRTHPDLLKRLFELEVPEIHDGIVEIKSVAREAGMRSKIAVYAKDESVDPIGSCVGHRGFRVQAIVDELRNEKIDIVKWSEDPAVYIANALSPAKVVSVDVAENEKMSRVVVPDYQLSLAIGKEGQNARLAAKLTGWKIDIKSETQAEEEGEFLPSLPEEACDEAEDEMSGEDFLAEFEHDTFDADDAEADAETAEAGTEADIQDEDSGEV
ncbi:transcription termination factor NusA [Anaerovibrio sp.]|uniref:transcription termination factor NusA n=1 Tax=Anaerovibrio sp. TaxID=1872532 RepID=UPI003F15F75D